MQQLSPDYVTAQMHAGEDTDLFMIVKFPPVPSPLEELDIAALYEEDYENVRAVLECSGDTLASALYVTSKYHV